MTQCKSCGAEIEFIKTINGKMNPVNVEPYYIIVTDKGETYRGQISHFATCIGASEFRKK